MCCIAYKGVKYHYAFELSVSSSLRKDEIFRIIISKYRKEYKDFSGLCLNNELKIISNKNYPVAAFADIINKIVDYTISDRQAYAEAHEGEIPTPLRCVDDENIIKEFEKHKDSPESLFYSVQLRNLFKMQKHISENKELLENLKPIEDILNLMYIFYYSRHILLPQLQIRKAFTL